MDPDAFRALLRKGRPPTIPEETFDSKGNIVESMVENKDSDVVYYDWMQRPDLEDDWPQDPEDPNAKNKPRSVAQRIYASKWPAMAAKLASLVLFLFIIVGIPLLVVFVPRPTPAPASAETPAPSSGADARALYASATAYVYAAASYADGDVYVSYVATRWKDAGSVHHMGEDYALAEEIEACPDVDAVCSLLLVTNGTHALQVLRFPSFRIDRVAVNETHVFVFGVGAIADGSWTAPGAPAPFDRNHTGPAGAVVSYTRAAALLSYRGAALVLQPAGGDAEIEFGKTEISTHRVYVPFSGACPEGETWRFSYVFHANHTADEPATYITCSRYQSIVLVYTDDILEAGWFFESASDLLAPVVHVNLMSNEGASEIYVYGVYASDPDAVIPFAEGDNPEGFQVPSFATAPTPGSEIVAVTSPPGPVFTWNSDWPAAFVARYDRDTYDFLGLGRHEVASRELDARNDGYTLTLCGSTVTFTTLHAFAITLTDELAAFDIEDEDPDSESPFCCEWNTNDGTVQECNLWRGTANARATEASPPIVTATTAGWLQRSDDIIETAPVGYTEGAQINFTIPDADARVSQSNLWGTFDDGALVYDPAGGTDRIGQYVFDGMAQRVWYALDTGIKMYD